MRLLADENIPARVVAGLRAIGHDVRAIAEELRGSSDTEVAACATRDLRILVTLDKDFGELAMTGRLDGNLVVVLLRIDPPEPASLLAVLADVLPQTVGDRSALWVVTDQRARRRPFGG
jgi:predicted nuclease of predicted toxin-antitoxin system